jgi:hypothetical protein
VKLDGDARMTRRRAATLLLVIQALVLRHLRRRLARELARAANLNLA